MSEYLFALLISPLVALVIVLNKKEQGWLAVLDFFLYTFILIIFFEMIALLLVTASLYSGN